MPRSLLRDVGACPPPTFWRFATTLVAAQLAGIGAGWALRRLTRDSHPTTSKTVTFIGSAATFWIAAGATWMLLDKQKPDVRLEPGQQS